MKKPLLILLFLAVTIGVLYLVTFTVSEKEHVIVTRFGKPVRVVSNAGLHFKLPGFFATPNRIDKRVHVFVTQPIQLLLGDKNPIILTCYVCWKVSNPRLFFQSVTLTDSAQQKLGDMVNSQLGNVLGDYTISQVINTDAEKVRLANIENTILSNSNYDAHEKYGLDVIQIGIRRINYPSIVAEAVYNRMRSEREKEARKFRAQGTQEAAKIEAETDKQVSEILAKAYQQAENIKGEGDKEAIKIFAAAYGQDPAFFEFVRSLQLYSDVLQGKSTLILSTDSDLFKFLISPEQIKGR